MNVEGIEGQGVAASETEIGRCYWYDGQLLLRTCGWGTESRGEPAFVGLDGGSTMRLKGDAVLSPCPSARVSYERKDGPDRE